MIYAPEHIRARSIPNEIMAVCYAWESRSDHTVTARGVLGDAHGVTLRFAEGQRHVATFAVVHMDALNLWLPDGFSWRRGAVADLRAALEMTP